MATIAVAHGVDQIAAESHQRLVFLGEIQRNRRDFESLAHSCIDQPVVIVILPGTCAPGTDHDAHKQHRWLWQQLQPL